MIMKNKTYDMLKWVALLVMPSLATFVLALGGIWNIPHADQIGATITALNALLGGCLGISSNNYKKQE